MRNPDESYFEEERSNFRQQLVTNSQRLAEHPGCDSMLPWDEDPDVPGRLGIPVFLTRRHERGALDSMAITTARLQEDVYCGVHKLVRRYKWKDVI